jgi:phosphoglycolate phosphatase-like HAD superfamily hydrolase
MALLRHSNADACNAIYVGGKGTDAEAARKAKVPFGALRLGVRGAASMQNARITAACRA